MEQLERIFKILKSSLQTNSESCRTYNMVIQKCVNGFEAVNYFRKKIQTSDSWQGSEKAAAILTSKNILQ